MTRRYSAAVPNPEADEIEQLAEEKEINTSEAIRRLIKTGIRERESATKEKAEMVGNLGWASLASALAAIALDLSLVAGGLAAVAALLFLVSVFARWRAIEG